VAQQPPAQRADLARAAAARAPPAARQSLRMGAVHLVEARRADLTRCALRRGLPRRVPSRRLHSSTTGPPLTGALGRPHLALELIAFLLECRACTPPAQPTGAAPHRTRNPCSPARACSCMWLCACWGDGGGAVPQRRITIHIIAGFGMCPRTHTCARRIDFRQGLCNSISRVRTIIMKAHNGAPS